jgi:MFS family permease
VIGYGLAALTKPLFPLAQSAILVLVARFVDRIGKGIRGAPRDALIADITSPDARGAAYGLRQALDTAGALLGPLIGLALLSVLSGDDSHVLRTVFWIAAVPAFVAVVVLVLFVHEPADRPTRTKPQLQLHWRELHQLGSAFWFVVILGGVFALARFSEAFLILRATDVGLALKRTPLALAVMNIVYVASAYPFGQLADRIDRAWLLASGLVVLIASDVILGLTLPLSMIFVGIALWGLQMGLTQGLFSAMVADAAPAGLRGSAFGVFYFVTGICALLASGLAGLLWASSGPELTFRVGAAISAIALCGLLGYRSRYRKAS